MAEEDIDDGYVPTLDQKLQEIVDQGPHALQHSDFELADAIVTVAKAVIEQRAKKSKKKKRSKK